MNTLLPTPLLPAAPTKSFVTTWLARRRRTCAALLGVGSLVATVPAARAQSVGALTPLYSFSATDANGVNADGSNPPNVILASDGNLYGVARLGGTTGNGAIFQLTPAGQFTALYSFTGGADGSNPFGHLTYIGDNNLYGTTTNGGSSTASAGTIFKFNLNSKVLTTIYTFQGEDDQGNPFSALVPDGKGGFYGTTSGDGDGTIFHLSSASVLTTVHGFNASTEGNSPQATPLLASDGNLYGTTLGGGASGFGTIYQFNLGTGQLSVLYSFPTGSSSFGAGATSTLLEGPDGSLYGTATYNSDSNNGYVFKIAKSGGVPTVLYQFTGGNDGSDPYGGVVLAADGNLLGTAEKGGANGTGTIYELPITGGTPSILYTFSAQTNKVNAEGYNPSFPLVSAGNGNYYGQAFRGGSGGSGAIYEFSVHPAFFAGEVSIGNGVDYLAFASGSYFGYYSFLTDPRYIYHFDLGYEYVFEAADGKGGVYLYDFKSGGYFYTSPAFPFPYLYDFSLNSVLYYYPDPSNAGHYNTNGVRYFFEFATGKIISK